MINKAEIIKDVLHEGIFKDLYLTRRSLAVSKVISKRHKTLNDDLKKNISSMVYDLCYTSIVSSLGRIYDTYDKNRNKKYPTRCLKRLYSLVKENDYELELASIIEIKNNFAYFGFPEYFQQLLVESESVYLFKKRIIIYFDEVEENDLEEHLDKLKTLRGKIVSHNEQGYFEDELPYELADALISHAEHVASYFSLAYLGTKERTRDFVGTWPNTFKRFLDS